MRDEHFGRRLDRLGCYPEHVDSDENLVYMIVRMDEKNYHIILALNFLAEMDDQALDTFLRKIADKPLRELTPCGGGCGRGFMPLPNRLYPPYCPDCWTNAPENHPANPAIRPLELNDIEKEWIESQRYLRGEA